MLSEQSLRTIMRRAISVDARELEWESAGASSFHSTYHLLVDGERYFLKLNASAQPGHFEAEAAGLRALKAAAPSLRIPEVFGFADGSSEGSFLILEYLDRGPSDAQWAEKLGRGLAEMHAPRPLESYGFEVDGYCGRTVQPNPRSASWVEFYGQHRLRHLGDLARAGGLPAATSSRLETLVERLDEWIGETEGPSLIHGDLWSGNAMALRGAEAALVDPAAHWAEREAELGMMALFGGFPPRVWEAYQEVRPLRPGWRHRLGLYQLYHLLNHFVLFGGHYAAEVDRVLRLYVG